MVAGHGRPHLSWLLVTVGVAAMLAGAIWWFATPAQQVVTPAAPTGSEASSTAPSGQPRSPSAKPARARTEARAVPPRRTAARPHLVRLPAIEVAAPVDPIRAEAGTLVPPDDVSRLGWWSDGAKPGARYGSVLITGHTVHDGDGVLDDLALIERGDRAVVETARGPVRYTVERVRVFNKGRVARHAEQLFAQDVPGRLVLVSCADWDGERYLSNVVVTATPVR